MLNPKIIQKKNKQKPKKQIPNIDIQIPKASKMRRRPNQRNPRSPKLRILDGLNLSEDDNEKNKELSKIFAISENEDSQLNTSNPIQIEKTDKVNIPQIASPTEQDQYNLSSIYSTSPKQSPTEKKPFFINKKSMTDLFESSIINYLSFQILDVRSNFLYEFKHEIDQYFDLNSTITNFLFQFRQELNDIISNTYNQINLESNLTSQIENLLKPDFDSFSTITQNQKKDSNHIFSSSEDIQFISSTVKMANSDYSNRLKSIVDNFSKEIEMSKFQSNIQIDEDFFLTSQTRTNINELETKNIHLLIEEKSINQRNNFLKNNYSQISYSSMFNQEYQHTSFQDEIDDLISDLKNVKNYNQYSNFYFDFQTLINEIQGIDMEIISKSTKISKIFPKYNSINQYSSTSNIDFNMNSYHNNGISFYNAIGSNNTINYSDLNLSVNQNSDFYINETNQSEFIRDIRTKLMKAKKMREDTIADVNKLGPIVSLNEV